MDKIHKKTNKRPKNKKNQPLKVVYIANPIKFKTSVSEFRALVQELTGRDSDSPETARFAVADDVSGRHGAAAAAVEVAEEGSVHHEVTTLGFNSSNGHGELANGSGGSMFGSYYNPEVFDPMMINNFPWGGDF